MKNILAAISLVVLALSFCAHAQITIGVDLSTIGPAAPLGVPEKNAILIGPTEIAGQKIRYVIMDDGSDPTVAVQNVKRLTSQDHIDVLLGPSVTPASLAVLNVVAEAKTPMISFGSAIGIISPVDEKRRWAFKTPPNDDVFISAVLNHMVKKGWKTLAIIAMDDALGESWINVIGRLAPTKGINIVTIQKFQRSDTSTVGQALRVIQSKPDAVLIVAAGTPAVTPHRDLVTHGYKGGIFQSTADSPEFIHVGGKEVEGGLVLAKPVIVAEQLPAGYPVKATALEFLTLYEGKYGAGTRSGFAAHAWDALKLLQTAVPVALKQAKPGTVQFREALRSALESCKDVRGAAAVFNMTPTDHSGVDERGIVVITVENGAWKLAL